MTLQPNASLSYQLKPWLYYGSLLAILLLSLASHFIADVAKGQSTDNMANVGLYVIAQYTLMAFFMLLAWYNSPNESSFRHYKALLMVAIITRVVLIDIAPYTSNDVDRYLFDGRIAYEGYDPYQLSHDSPQLTELRAQWQPPPEHAAYATLYPPVSLALFAFASSFGVENAQLAWQWLLLIAGLSTVWVAALVLKQAKKLKHIALVALSPLLILETGVGLHIDAFSTLAVISALYLWQQKRNALCGAIIGLGMAIKILPVMLLLPFFFSQKTMLDAFTLVFNCVLTVALIYCTTYALGYYPVGSIGVFFEKWRSASPLFSLIGERLSSTEIVIVILSILTIFSSAIAYLSFRYRRSLATKDNQHPEQASSHILYASIQMAIALPLLVSPVVFPWYLLPLVPVLALWPNKYLIGWMLIMPLTYEVLGQFIAYQLWQPAQWPINMLSVWFVFTLCCLALFMVKQFKSPAAISRNDTAPLNDSVSAYLKSS